MLRMVLVMEEGKGLIHHLHVIHGVSIVSLGRFHLPELGGEHKVPRPRTISSNTGAQDGALKAGGGANITGEGLCVGEGVGKGGAALRGVGGKLGSGGNTCLLYTSDAADEEDSVDLGGRRIIKKKKKIKII
eukprot:TRINITY_DN1157_c0_g1_i14.p2 TRINITY_DN1157_c0_g1~~TRINITY_DN1157_c0_g1_i14.p2  ORF type:complete len:132 (+),score=28.12 TRINITY_DN1157_c0_g1_i14:391-786(+)